MDVVVFLRQVEDRDALRLFGCIVEHTNFHGLLPCEDIGNLLEEGWRQSTTWIALIKYFEITHIFETLIKFCENVKFKNIS